MLEFSTTSTKEKGKKEPKKGKRKLLPPRPQLSTFLRTGQG
jgi:hypothetical protein